MSAKADMQRRLLIILTAAFAALPCGFAHAGTITLPEAVDIALRSNPALVSAQEAINASRAQTVQSASPYYPKITASTGYSSGSSTTAFGDSITRGTTTTLAASQMLYDFGKTGNALDAVQAAERSAELDRQRAVQEVVLNVKQAYFGVLRSMRLQKVSQQNLELLEGHLAQAQAFFRSGSRPRFEVTRAEVEVNNARMELLNATNTVRINRISLDNAMGGKLASADEIEEVQDAPASVPPVENVQQIALRGRPEMRKAEASIAMSEARLRAEESQYLPSLSAAGTYNWANGVSTMGPYRADLANSWTASVTLSLSLFEGGITRGKVAEARANLYAARAQRDTLEQTVLLEVNQAYADMENASARRGVMESSLNKARENLTIAEGRYQAGISTQLEVNDARVAELKAEVDSVQARYDQQLALARLEKAAGGPLAPETAH